MARTQPSTLDPYWRKHYDRFLWQTGDTDVADDLCQELMIKVALWQAVKGQPQERENFINTVHARVLVDWLRKKRRQPLRLDDELALRLADERMRPDREVAGADWQRVAQAELASVIRSTTDRAILDDWNVPPRELALSLGTTARQITTARNRLTARIRENPSLRNLFNAARER